MTARQLHLHLDDESARLLARRLTAARDHIDALLVHFRRISRDRPPAPHVGPTR